MKYIHDNDTLMGCIPNVVTAVEGEKDLFTKMQPHLQLAEAWMEANVVPYETIKDNEIAKAVAVHIVANEAFRRAVPSLDIILTENGFGIVSNNTVAPASRDRINALLDGLQAMVDESVEALDTLLSGAVLKGTIFKGYEAQRMQGVTKDLFARYRSDRQKIIAIEDSIAERVISHEVLAILRNAAYSRDVPEQVEILRSKMKHHVIRRLTGKVTPMEAKEVARQLVDRIRKNPELFPGWEESEAAKYWADYTYKNDKNSGGFWL